jgi:hypothetical protein
MARPEPDSQKGWLGNRDRFGGARCDDGGDDAAGRGSGRPRVRPILGRMPNAPRELAARRGAITSWRTKAARLGRPFTSWRLASRKRYECGQMTNGNFVCLVFAVPCRIVRRPPSARRRPSRPKIAPLPLPRIKPRPPKDANREI